MIEIFCQAEICGGVTSFQFLPPSRRQMNQAIVGARPDPIQIERRRRDRVNHAALRRLRGRLRLYFPTVAGTSKVLRVRSGLILLPILSAVARFPKRVGGEEKNVRINRREDHRLGPHHAKIRRAKRFRQNVLGLAGAAIVTRQLAAVDDVRIERIGRDVAVFFRGDRMPVAESDLAVVAAARDADRAAFLLAAAQSIRKRVVGADVIELRGRLVVPRAPGLAAVDGDDRALVARRAE